jgi:cytochrome-b5 reductase
MKVGDTLECKGPIMKLEYKPNMKASIGMVAGGTGITPMLQVIEEVLRNPEDKTTLSLVFGNVTQEDILLKSRIDALAAKHPKQFKVLYLLDKPPANWKGGSGYVTAAMLKETMPTPNEKHLVLVCGPPGMMEAVSGGKAKDFTQGELKGVLRQLGYNASEVFKF